MHGDDENACAHTPSTIPPGAVTNVTAVTPQVKGTSSSRSVTAVTAVTPLGRSRAGGDAHAIADETSGAAHPTEVRVTLSDDPIGWERLGVIIDVRAAVAAGLVHITGDNRILIHRDVPADLRERMARHRDVVEYALGGPDPDQLWENQ